MQTDYNTYEGLRAILEKETPILIAQIRALYRELDKKFHLQRAKVPITFGFETDSLESYNQNGPLQTRICTLYEIQHAYSEAVSVAAWDSRKCMEILLFVSWCGTNSLLQSRRGTDES